MSDLIPIILPPDQQEGTSAAVGTWLVKAGDSVRLNQPLLEVNTDKVSVEIAAPADGVIAEILKTEGEEISPGEPLAYLRPGSVKGGQKMPAPLPGAGAVAPPAEPAAEEVAGDNGSADRLSPSVRRALKEHRLEPGQIQGTGRGGRITFQDVQEFLKTRQPAASVPGKTAVTAIPPGASSRRIPHSPMRLSIARHMVESLLKKAPHVTAVFETNFQAVLSHYRQTRDGFAEKGIRLTLTSYLVAASAHALSVVPEVNSRWHDDALEVFADSNIGIATALGNSGLVVPIVRRAQDLNLFGIATQLQTLTEKARSGRLTASDLEGGTFTITNHGVSGSLIATPIINQPQTAILGAGKIEKRVRVRETADGDSIEIRPMAYVTLSIDHRALDGFTANRFLSAFCQYLENWPRAD